MLASKGKISVRQAIMLFILAIFSPAIRLFPYSAAKTAGKAGWLAPIVAIIPIILLILLLNSFFKKNEDGNLSDVYFKILGNIAGKIIISLYFIWTLVLLALYTRYYSERILSSMMPNTSSSFLIIVMLCLVFLTARRGLETMARANEIFFILLLAMFLVSFILSIPQIKYRNIMNVSYLDAWPVIKSSFDLFGVWGYVLFIFFFADKINNKECIKRFGFQGVAFILIITILLLIMTIGSLGPSLASHVSLPFFTVVKNISVLETIDHIESVLLAAWVICDFIIIISFTIISASLMKSIFKLSETKSLISPIVIFAGIGSLFLFENLFELEIFSRYIALPVNVLFEFIIPFAVFGIGKIRKMI